MNRTVPNGLNPQMIAQIKGIMQNVNSPQMKMIMQMTRGRGISPQQLVTNMCQQQGIDVNSQTQKILDAINGNRMADMQNQINQLQLQSAMCGVVRYPTTYAYNAGQSPFCGGNTCG